MKEIREKMDVFKSSKLKLLSRPPNVPRIDLSDQPDFGVPTLAIHRPDHAQLAIPEPPLDDH